MLPRTRGVSHVPGTPARQTVEPVSQAARRARRAGKVVLQLYREYAAPVADAARRMGVTCRDGCAHCCKLPATATVPEMVLVVEYLVSRGDWEKRRPALERALEHQLTEFATINVLVERERTSFFRRQIACAFLKDDRCEIYSVRPAVCRYHMAVSPPENCEVGPEDKPISMVNLHKIESTIALKGAAELGELTGGPIALTFVLAADLLGVKLDIKRSLIDRVSNVSLKVTKSA